MVSSLDVIYNAVVVPTPIPAHRSGGGSQGAFRDRIGGPRTTMTSTMSTPCPMKGLPVAYHQCQGDEGYAI